MHFRHAGSLCVAALALVIATSAFAATGVRLEDRVLRANELMGFKPGKQQREEDPRDWAKIAPGALTHVEHRLRQEGFVGAVREELAAASSDRGALSMVLQLSNKSAARTELARQLQDYATEGRRLAGHTYAAFAVMGIPGAHGFVSTDPNGGAGINVIFADGAFVYHVGAGWAHGARSHPTKTDVVGAARHLYGRVHGR